MELALKEAKRDIKFKGKRWTLEELRTKYHTEGLDVKPEVTSVKDKWTREPKNRYKR